MTATNKRHTIVPASYLILEREEKILLLRRYQTGYEDGKYSMVAGHVDKDETFTEALVREAREEVGIRIQPEHLKVVHVMHRKSYDSERADIFFVAKQWEGEIQNKEPHKCDNLSWFSPAELPENIIPYIRQAVECTRDGIFYSESGWEEK